MNCKRLIVLNLFVCFCLITLTTNGQKAFEFEGQLVDPGHKAHFPVKVGDDMVVPITIFNGSKNGSVLGITAGVHGYEYAPILAGQELIQTLDPKKLQGTVILVQIANVAGFSGRVPYFNPLDGKNLNRSFPGSETGTITEQIAHFISQEVIARCDYFIDMHSGDAPEDLMPYAAYYANDHKPEASDMGKKMASSLGFEHIVVFNTTGKDYMQPENPSLYCSAEAFKRGIPAADVECGRLGMVEGELVQQIVQGVHQLLSSLGLSEHTSGTSPDSQVFIRERSFMSSEFTGIFYPSVNSGDFLEKGDRIGYITDFFNNSISDVHADMTGIVLFVLGTPPVNKGETICVIGKVK